MIKLNEEHNFSDVNDTNWQPDSDDLERLRIGEFVKVCHNAERFWVQITEHEPENKLIKAVINHDLVLEQPFKCGDTITFNHHNVYQTQ